MNNGPKIQHNTIILPAHESESLHFCFPLAQADTKENSSPSRANKRTVIQTTVSSSISIYILANQMVVSLEKFIISDSPWPEG